VEGQEDHDQMAAQMDLDDGDFDAANKGDKGDEAVEQ
jgi:hypothetical protein